MHLLQVIESLRQVFASAGVAEVPPFPAPLSEPWCHPDFYFTMSGKGLPGCFAFQFSAPAPVFLADPTMSGPDLIWVANIDSADFSDWASKFFDSARQKLLPDQEDAVFSLLPDSRRRFLSFESGVSWKVLFAGVECGRLTAYSAVPGFSLPEKVAAVLSLNVRMLARLTASPAASEAVLWGDAVSFDKIFVAHAWQKNDDFEGTSLQELSSRLEKMLSATEISSEKSLCDLLYFYNLHARSINKSYEISQLFAAKLRNIREQYQAQNLGKRSTANVGTGDSNVQ